MKLLANVKWIILFSVLGSASAIGEVTVSWEILDSGRNITPTDSISFYGKITNDPTSTESINLGLAEAELRGLSWVIVGDDYGNYYNIFGANYAAQFSGINLAPGQSYEFLAFTFRPNVEYVPAKSYGSLLFAGGDCLDTRLYLMIDNQEQSVSADPGCFRFTVQEPQDPRFLGFPLRLASGEEISPYDAKITSVFDHSMSKKIKVGKGKNSKEIDIIDTYTCDGVVTSFSTERADDESESRKCSAPAIRNRDSEDVPNEIYLSGNYVSCCGSDTTWMQYDGHPGIDYDASFGTNVYMPVDGTISYPTKIAGLTQNVYTDWHALQITPSNATDFRIILMHLSTHPNCLDEHKGKKWGEEYCNSLQPETVTNPAPDCPTSLPAPPGYYPKGCLIAKTGNKAPHGVSLGSHLHFEVQKVRPKVGFKGEFKSNDFAITEYTCPDDDTKFCLPVDPYGWAGTDRSPQFNVTGMNSTNLWSHLPYIFNVVAVPDEESASVEQEYIVTASAIGLDGNSTFCFVALDGLYESGVQNNCEIPSSADYEYQLPAHMSANIIGIEPGEYLLHILTSEGTKSNVKKVSISAP